MTDNPKVTAIATVLRAEPHTVTELATAIGMSRETVFRYLREIEDRLEISTLIRVGSSRPSRYQIVRIEK